jgi:phytoene dehydrogenase-like protein
MRPLVIGSGANGLAAAFYLARAGRRPLVLEKADAIGGGAITAEIHPGFHAPVYSHELLLHEALVRDMALRAHGLEWIDTDVDACAPALDGPPLTIFRDGARAAESIRLANATDAETWPRYRETMRHAARVIAPLLTSPPPALPPGMWTLLDTRRRLTALGRNARSLLRWLPMPVADFVDEWFEHDRLRALIAASCLSGTMLAPRSAGSTLILLLREAYQQLAGGHTRQARGGPGACMRAMAAAAQQAGAEIRTGSAVERILTRRGRVSGVIAAGREIDSDLVISTLDPQSTLLTLTTPGALPADVVSQLTSYRARGTMAKVNLALSALPVFAGLTSERLLTGRIHLGALDLDDLERAFDAVKYGEMSADPWLDLRIPSIADSSLAPSGGHVASMYVHNVPYSVKDAASAQRDEALRRTLHVLERYAPGSSRLVLAAQVVTPADLEGALGVAGGHIFHGELSPDQLFAARPVVGLARYRTPIGGLYLGGAGSHPGGFLAGISGRLAARAALGQR